MFQSTTRAPVKGPVISAARMAEHEGLVCWVVRQQWLGRLSFLDALHAGRIGLWRALRGYDPTRGTCFRTYAVPVIARAVWQAVDADQKTRVPRRGGQILPAVAPPRPDESSAETDPVEKLHQGQVQTTLRTLITHLSPRLRHVIVAHYGLGAQPPQSFAAIGAPLGLTRQRVQQLHVEALLWLAHPAHSRTLRHLLDRHTRTDYQRTLARQYHVARARRSPTPPSGGTRP